MIPSTMAGREWGRHLLNLSRVAAAIDWSRPASTSQSGAAVTNLIRSDSFQPRRARTLQPSQLLHGPHPPSLSFESFRARPDHSRCAPTLFLCPRRSEPACPQPRGPHISGIVMTKHENQPPHIVTHNMMEKDTNTAAYIALSEAQPRLGRELRPPSLAPRSGQASMLPPTRCRSARAAWSRTCRGGERPRGAGGTGRGACGPTVRA